MIRRAIVWLAISAVCPASAIADATPLAPEQGTVMSLDIGGKQSTYYRLEKESETFISVTGPARLICFVRLVYPSNLKEAQSYTVVVSESGRILKTVTSETRPSEWQWVGAHGEAAGLSRKFSVRVAEGNHRLRLELKQTSARAAAVRFKLTKGAPHGSEISLHPVAMAGTTTILVNERPLDYFLGDSNKPVVVKVIGPTRLRVVTRLAYSGTMKGTQRYGLRVVQDGRAVSTEALSTQKALTSSFANHTDWSVGESRTVYFPVADGEHSLEFRLSGSDAPAVALRFTIPLEDVDADSK